MRFAPDLLKNIYNIEKRYFTDTTKVKLNSTGKKEIIVLHPILKKSKKYSKSCDETLYDAQEALGLARSAGFKIANGISMPSGGWTNMKFSNEYNKKSKIKDLDKLDGTREIKHTDKEAVNNLSSSNSPYVGNIIKKELSYKVNKNYSNDDCFSERSDCSMEEESFEKGDSISTKEDYNTENGNSSRKGRKSDDSDANCNYRYNHDYGCDGANDSNYLHARTKCEELEKKIAESIIIKVNRMDVKFYFGKGKLNELSKYFLKKPAPYIFINTLLSPEQFRNLDFLFNSLLKSYHDELQMNSRREKEENYFTFRVSDCVYNRSSEEQGEGDGQGYVDMYNDYLEEYEGEVTEKGEESEDDDKDGYPYERAAKEICERKSGQFVPIYVELFDRYSIILYIMKRRAKSNLSKLQLELARANFILNTYSEDNKSRMKYIKYIENNVLGKSQYDYEERYDKINAFDVDKQNKKKNYDYLGYTSNYIKNTETYKEYEKRIINNLYDKLRKELTKCKNNNSLQNISRKHKALIAIVGYTNAGKTKLINYLTKSNLKARNLLFQTLDNSYKNLNIADCYSTIFIDLIGFIQNIPYSLYESFKISLDAIKNADIVIHVIDVSHPHKERQKKCVIDTLRKIGIADEFIQNNVVEVWNKIDKLTEQQIFTLYKNKPKSALPISAKNGTNCDILIKIVQKLVNKIKNVQVLTLQFPTKEAQERINFIRKNFKVVPDSISYTPDGHTTIIKLVENPSNLKKYYEKFGE
ncbi:GTP-binding protein [Plasmodium brasilianum]|uniref:GTP-binding protein n=1 Tax=Plasmodium brasilianum TaxID=5824 RepID=A0ACB9Y9B1_PLABR|nr:GTP-binding protein [Plasmodium brasilianum]